MSTNPSEKRARARREREKERIEILYEDEAICVIVKPAGLLTCPYPGSRAKTAQSILETIMRNRGTLGPGRRPLAVHRLDRDTSGVMMFALTQSAQKKIMDTWRTMVTERLYRAVAENPKSAKDALGDEGLIDDELSLNAHNVGFVPSGEMKKSGKVKVMKARTHFRVVERGKTHTLFELSLDTGKKNQIRAHLAAHGYPLAGDTEHRARTDRFHRLCLHARTLSFVHPLTGKAMSFVVPEDPAWLEYVRSGDEPSVRTERTRRTKSAEGVFLGEKRIGAKERAHSNFIEIGKRRT